MVAVLTACDVSASEPTTPVFTGLALQDATVMQSFAYDSAHKTWVFSQLTAGKPASAGDLTLTKVSNTGKRLGWMHLVGFGHGITVVAEPCGTATCIWTEAHAVAEPALGWADAGSYGTEIARFTWRNSATITINSTGVTRYKVNAEQPEQSASINFEAGLIAIQYWSTAGHVFRWAIYSLAAFKQHKYTALARVTVPASLANNGITEQGWALINKTTLINWQGNAKPSDNATLSWVNTSGSVTDQVHSSAGASLSWREPEGVTVIGSTICTGFASGVVGARRANVYCTAKP